ncbi:hypothetical protein [Bradyrhizobium sp. Tv2a-2]|uniref:hypothetical protein n=1 Tax=Bradyrhizobium sp. Tv2a-2 TaxID=113395 RepID=UPI0004219F72|nr:hypothetical protein [Bradyrhizobium sp. Tv2a-2]
MTHLDIQAHYDRIAHISRDHWRQYESYEEHAARVVSAKNEAAWYFDHATALQAAAYVRAMHDLQGLSAPVYDRAREAANRDWYASTAEARKLYERTFEDFMRDGEIQESTSELWEALDATAEAA